MAFHQLGHWFQYGANVGFCKGPTSEKDPRGLCAAVASESTMFKEPREGAYPANQHWIRSCVFLDDKELIPNPAPLGAVKDLSFFTPLPVSVQ